MIQILCLIALFSATQSHAVETSIQIQKPNQDKSYGYTIAIGDEFFNQKSINWQVSYNRLDNIMVSDLDETSQTWNDANLDFTLQTIELGLAYRIFPRSYNKFISSLMFEVQLAAAVNLSDHKFTFRPTIEREDVYFANQGDINPVISIAMQKSFTKNSAMQVGFKLYPSYSDFGSISTLYIGFNYRFGRQVGY
ncbi:hypothetical protein KO502_09275 [Colwellia sp. E2M01]|nr:hypothetical protein [Colwellia sp. E2M01]